MEWISLKSLAKITGFSADTLRAVMYAGLVPYTRKGKSFRMGKRECVAIAAHQALRRARVSAKIRHKVTMDLLPALDFIGLDPKKEILIVIHERGGESYVIYGSEELIGRQMLDILPDGTITLLNVGDILREIDYSWDKYRRVDND